MNIQITKKILFYTFCSLILNLTELQAQNGSWCTELELHNPFEVDNGADMIIVNGNPAIAYAIYDIGTDVYELFYIRAMDAKGTAWNTPIKLVGNMAGCSGQSIAIVNGFPAIAFQHHQDASPNHSLRYIRANDADGDTWGSVVEVVAHASGQQRGHNPSLAVIGGNPAIAYHENTGNDLFYARSTDVNGASGWSTTLVDGNNAGDFLSLLEVQGLPAIGYYNNNGGTSGHAKYIRATNTTGTSWGSAVTLSTGLTIISGRWTDMAIVNGNPAIVFNQAAGGGTQALRYVRANDNTGSSWPATTAVLTTTPSSGDEDIEIKSYSLAVINGIPAISYYYDLSNFTTSTFTRELRYITSMNADGSSWNSSVVINNNFNILFTHMIEIGSNASIVYIQSNASLRYVTQDCVISSTPSISIEAVSASSSTIEGSNAPIKFTFTISAANASSDTTVKFEISDGSASSDDFEVVTNGVATVTYGSPAANQGTIVIPMNQTTAELEIRPLANAIIEDNETVVVKVLAP